jgi:hypothetical protein
LHTPVSATAKAASADATKAGKRKGADIMRSLDED